MISLIAKEYLKAVFSRKANNLFTVTFIVMITALSPQEIEKSLLD
jgi:hypothetical protein